MNKTDQLQDATQLTANEQLLEAAQAGDLPLCLSALALGAQVNDYRADEEAWGPLHWAAANGHADICEALLAHGAHINHQDKWGQSALHVAACECFAPICIILLEHGVDYRLMNNKSKTATQAASNPAQKACASAIQAWLCAKSARAALQETLNTGAAPLL